MFTAEIEERVIRRQDGPHQTLRWRKKTRALLAKKLLEEPKLMQPEVEP